MTFALANSSSQPQPTQTSKLFIIELTFPVPESRGGGDPLNSAPDNMKPLGAIRR
jgi:hypothetical protein